MHVIRRFCHAPARTLPLPCINVPFCGHANQLQPTSEPCLVSCLHSVSLFPSALTGLFSALQWALTYFLTWALALRVNFFFFLIETAFLSSTWSGWSSFRSEPLRINLKVPFLTNLTNASCSLSHTLENVYLVFKWLSEITFSYSVAQPHQDAVTHIFGNS